METSHFLQPGYSTLPQYLPQYLSHYFPQYVPIQMFNTAPMWNVTYITPQNIDMAVEMEMKHVKENFLCKEEQYIEQMLLENPITIERRPNNNYQQQQPTTDDEELDVVNDPHSVTSKEQKPKFLQNQRAEACRRSRYNNKIKKAKFKYRYDFVSKKLLEDTQMFNYIHDFINKTENNLLANGFSRDKLQHLRNCYGLRATPTSTVKALE